MTVGRIPNVEGGIQPTLLTTAGDIMYASSASNPARLGIGSTGQVLTVASGVPSWATPSSGGMTLLSTTSLSGTSTTISGISGDYTNLQIIINNPFLTAGQTMRINPNSTDAINYQSGVQDSTTFSRANIITNTGVFLPTTSTATTTFCLQIFNYAQTSNGKNFIFSGGFTDNTGNVFGGGFIKSTSAISSLQFTTSSGVPSFSGGTVLIYGVK
jgi:hypothetical protein